MIKNQNVPVTCSYCKEKTAYCITKGYGIGGRTICKKCFEKENLKQKPNPDLLEPDSLGEEFAFKLYGI